MSIDYYATSRNKDTDLEGSMEGLVELEIVGKMAKVTALNTSGSTLFLHVFILTSLRKPRDYKAQTIVSSIFFIFALKTSEKISRQSPNYLWLVVGRKLIANNTAADVQHAQNVRQELGNVGTECVGAAITKQLSDQGKNVNMNSKIGRNPRHFEVINSKRQDVSNTEERHGAKR
jgi:hypothetical protein